MGIGSLYFSISSLRSPFLSSYYSSFFSSLFTSLPSLFSPFLFFYFFFHYVPPSHFLLFSFSLPPLHTVVAITHDRYFLENSCSWILEMDRGEGIPYEGTISAFSHELYCMFLISSYRSLSYLSLSHLISSYLIKTRLIASHY